ncbi:MAG: ABC transporter permease [Eubacteriales bacterium]
MKNSKISNQISNISLVILLIVSVILFSLLSDKFFTQMNITNVLVQNIHVAVLAAAVLVLMVSGGVDLSIGYQISVASVLIAKSISVWAVPVWASILIGIFACVIMGTFNGYLAQKLKSHTMIISLGTMAVFQGLSYLISESKVYYNLPRSYMYIGQGRLFGWLPFNAIIFIVVLLITGYILNKTYLGRHIYAVGDNPEASRLAGLNVNKIKMIAYIMGGVLVGIASVLISSRSGSADSTMGPDLTFTGITACVLAGVALKGGEGVLWKVIVAVFVLGVLSNGMQLVGLGTYPQYITKGAIMLISIYLSNRNMKAV